MLRALCLACGVSSGRSLLMQEEITSQDPTVQSVWDLEFEFSFTWRHDVHEGHEGGGAPFVFPL